MNNESVVLRLAQDGVSAVLRDILVRMGIEHWIEVGNGHGPQLVVQLRPGDDQQLLALWDELTALRVRYLEARQAQVVQQLSFLDGEGVIL